MIVGAMLLDLRLDGCRSLKDKRRIVRSLLERTRTQFHVAIAEVDDMDLWQNAGIGVSCVSNNQVLAESTLRHVLDFIDENPLVETASVLTEMIRIP
jgi:uncharacterized protein YlxP (DUF503 family)